MRTAPLEGKNEPRISQMGTDDPRKLGLADKKAKIDQACLQSFCFCPAPFATRMHPCLRLSVLIRVIGG
jgi:hypothetical protein